MITTLGWLMVGGMGFVMASKSIRRYSGPGGDVEEIHGSLLPEIVGGGAMVALSCYFIGVGLGVGGGVTKTAGSQTGSFEYSAPNTPTLDVAVTSTTLWSWTGSAFVGTGDATHDSTRIQVDTAGGNFASPLIDSIMDATTSGQLGTTNLAEDGEYVARLAYKADPNKGDWSPYDSVSVTNTVATFMRYLPSGWADTVIDDDMSTAGVKVFGADTIQTIGIWTYSNATSNSGAPGGRLTAHPDSTVRDSFTVAGAMSPPYVWESSYAPNLSGQGPDVWNEPSFTGGNRSRVFISIVTMYEDDGSPVGAPGDNDFVVNNSGTKFLEIYTDGSNNIRYGINFNSVFGVHGNPTQIVDPVTGCTLHQLVPNNWNSLHPGDTVTGLTPPCQNKGNFRLTSGVWEEWWICLDLSGATETIAFGKGNEIAGYHTGVASQGSAVEGMKIISTLGGGLTPNPLQSRYIDHITVIAGSSGSCVAP